MQGFRTALLGAAAMIAAMPAARADAVTDFYSGKQVTVIVNAGTGGLNGLYARTVGDRMGGHLPGRPKIIIQAMPGSGGIKGANYCYNVAPKDGSVLCHMLMATPHAQVLGTKGVKFDARRFTWIGRTATANSGLYVWHTEKPRTLEDARKFEVVLGATGKGSESYTDPTIINAVMGTRFKMILGYRGGGDLDLALERLEIKGQSGPLISVITRKPHWLAENKVRYLFQSGSTPHPKLAGVPLLTSLAKNDADRSLFAFLSSRADIGRTYAAPPAVPADRTAVLRKAFADTMKDPAFLADAAKRRIDVMPESAAFVEARIAELVDTPKDVIARAKKALGLK
jgi:tripartite-type tricarboxylate transporter receptor subunit TctC